MQEEEASPASATGSGSNEYGSTHTANYYTGGPVESGRDATSITGSLHHNSKTIAAKTEE
jgi:hypothetical protein